MELLVFDIGGELWGVDIRYVKEVVKVESVTKVPGAPPHLVGVFNLRGQIVPLVSLAAMVGLPQSEFDKAIIIEYEEEVIGLAVKDVKGMIRVDGSKMLPPPTETLELVLGVIRKDGAVIAVLSVEKLYELLTRG